MSLTTLAFCKIKYHITFLPNNSWNELSNEGWDKFCYEDHFKYRSSDSNYEKKGSFCQLLLSTTHENKAKLSPERAWWQKILYRMRTLFYFIEKKNAATRVVHLVRHSGRNIKTHALLLLAICRHPEFEGEAAVRLRLEKESTYSTGPGRGLLR